jgi:hypothetical protein
MSTLNLSNINSKFRTVAIVETVDPLHTRQEKYAQHHFHLIISKAVKANRMKHTNLMTIHSALLMHAHNPDGMRFTRLNKQHEMYAIEIDGMRFTRLNKQYEKYAIEIDGMRCTRLNKQYEKYAIEIDGMRCTREK